MTPKQQFICKLVGIILGALTPIVLAFLTFLQGQNNKAEALRNHDEVRRRHRFSTHAPARPSAPAPPRAPEFSRRTNIEALAESAQVAADKAADDTAKVLVQPTTVGRLLGVKARSVMVKALRSAR